MINLGEFIKAEISRKTGISSPKLSELSLNNSTKLQANVLCLIAKAINISPIEILDQTCRHLKLNSFI